MFLINLDKVVGLYHFVSDRTPKDIPIVEPKPRRVNAWRNNGHALVAKVHAGENIKLSISQAIKMLGGLGRAISRGDRVLVKPNFNSPDPFPASTDLALLEAMVETLLEAGARVTIGESSGGLWRPSRKVFHKLGVYDLARSLGVELTAFEDSDDWVRIKIDGDYLSTVTMPRSAYEADRMVYLPCMKTHNLARFSGALKLAVGFVHPGERRAFHLRHLQQKIAEISLCWQPDLIVMDGRKAFVSGGPDKGELVEPGVLLASADLVATDVEAMKLILTYPASKGLPPDPCQFPQIAAALKHGLGCGPGEYLVLG
jgi:uncharacterized protein (DUF362 family)